MGRESTMTTHLDKTTSDNIFQQLPSEMTKATKHLNILFVFDDVIG